MEKLRNLRVGDYASRPVITTAPDTSFMDAVSIMISNNIGNLVVVENENPVGVLTERELLQYLALNKTIPNRPVKYVLSAKFSRLTPDTSILDAAKTMISKKSRLLVFEKEKLIGIITASDIVRAFLTVGRNPSLRGAVTGKVYSLHTNNTILNAVKTMSKKRIGSVLVTADDKPYGIFTERDLLNKVLSKNVDIEERVGDYCTGPVITGKLSIGARDAAELMSLHKIKRLPLTSRRKIVAIITARDLVEVFQKDSKL